MKEKKIKKRRNELRVVLLWVLFLFFSLLSLIYLFEGNFSFLPENQIIDKENDLCIVSSWNSGSWDYVFLYTVSCDNFLSSFNSAKESVNCEGVSCDYSKGVYLEVQKDVRDNHYDVLEVSECEAVSYEDFDWDWKKEFRLYQNKLCSFFRGVVEVEDRFYSIDEEGIFEKLKDF